MSTRMLLEGTDIRVLLQQVRDGYGPEARIVHAERIRSGGMGGFFAKQRYEVTVEIDADAATSASASAIARSMLEEQVTPSDPVGVQVASAAALPVQQIAPSVSQAVTPPVSHAAPSSAAQAAAEHAAALLTPLVSPDPMTNPIVTLDATAPRATQQDLPVVAATSPAAPTTGAPAAAEQLAAAVPPPTPAPAATAPVSTPVPAPVPTPTVDPAMQRAAIDLVLDAVATGRPDDNATSENIVQRRPFVPPSLLGEELPLERETRDATGVEVPRPALTKVGPALEAPAPVNDLAARLEAQRDAALRTTAASALDQATTPAEDVPLPIAPVAPVVVPAPADAEVADVEELLPSLSETPRGGAVEIIAPVLRLTTTSEPAVTRATPVVAVPPMPRRPGDLLVLLGDPVSAYAAALTMAAGARIPVANVHVVSDSAPVPGLPEQQRVHDVLEARLTGAQLAMNRAAGIVVIDAPLSLVADPLGQDWVGDILDVLEATAVWAVVDATRRTEDVARWLAVVPEVSGLVVHDLALTSDPEAVHTLGVPVAIVDGKPATAPTTMADDGISATAVREAAMLAHPASHRRSS